MFVYSQAHWVMLAAVCAAVGYLLGKEGPKNAGANH